jgi:hypothetical protein
VHAQLIDGGQVAQLKRLTHERLPHLQEENTHTHREEGKRKGERERERERD